MEHERSLEGCYVIPARLVCCRTQVDFDVEIVVGNCWIRKLPMAGLQNSVGDIIRWGNGIPGNCHDGKFALMYREGESIKVKFHGFLLDCSDRAEIQAIGVYKLA